MTYTAFRDTIADALIMHPAGLTWQELRTLLDLPYRQPCPEWLRRLEQEIALERREKKGRALVWKLPSS